MKKLPSALLSFLLLLTLLPAPTSEAGDAGEIRKKSFQLLNQGVTAYRKGLYPEAVEKLELATSMALNNFRAHYYLGLALIGDRRYQEAIAILDVALDLDPNHLQSHIARGDSFLKLGDLTEAKASFLLAQKLRPEYAPSLDGLARIEQAGAEMDAATSLFRRAIKSDAGFAPAYTHLGDLYLSRDQFEEAVELLEEAVSVRPDFAAGLNRLAIAYGKLGLNTLAISSIRNARSIQPNHPSHPATLGWLQIERGLIATAEQSFLDSLKLDRQFPEARRGLAEVARRRGQYELALQQMDGALADERLDARERRQLQSYRQTLSDEFERLAQLEQIRDSGEAIPDDYAQLGMIYAARGQWDAAADAFDSAQGSASRDERLAFALFRAGRYRDALTVYQAAEGAESSYELTINLGVCAAKLGKDQEAVEAFERALELQPRDRTAQLYLGNALLRLGQREAAIAQYRQFLVDNSRGEAAERVRRILLQIDPQPEASS